MVTDPAEVSLAYWRSQIRGAPRRLELPYDFARNSQSGQSFSGVVPGTSSPTGPAPPNSWSVQTHQLSSELYAELNRWGQENRVRLEGALLATFQLLLARYCLQDDFVVGFSSCLQRDAWTQVSSLLEPTILPLRSDLTDNPGFEVLAVRTAQALAEGREHRPVRWSELFDGQEASPEGQELPIIQAAFRFEEHLLNAASAAETGPPGCELRLSCAHASNRLELQLGYDPRLFLPETITQLVAHFQALLSAGLSNPGLPGLQLPLVTTSERAQFKAWNATQTDYPRHATLPELFSAQAARVPDQIALKSGEEELSYRELDQASELLAERLRAAKLPPETPIALCLDRSCQCIVTLLGILKSGAAYVPLEPDYPRQRLRWMLSDTAAPLLLTSARHAHLFDFYAGEIWLVPEGVELDSPADGEPFASQGSALTPVPERAATGSFTSNALWHSPDGGQLHPGMGTPPKPVGSLQAANGNRSSRSGEILARHEVAAVVADGSPTTAHTKVSAESLAYIMYTSGSTGQPKGVAVTHRGIIRLVKETNYLRVQDDDVFLHFAPLAFDASTLEIWGPLLNGARLVLPPPGLLTLAQLGGVLTEFRVTVLWLTAGLFHQMVDYQLDDLRGLRVLLAGGDVLSATHVKRALSALEHGHLVNGYGPTENTTFTCCQILNGTTPLGEAVPIGPPIANTQVFIVEPVSQQLSPLGVSGELYTAGDGLAQGYWNQKELTAERFVDLEVEPGVVVRCYRTGDRARWNRAGYVEFQGRFDHQVKIRGFRIEPGEIEQVLCQHPGVAQAVVLPHTGPTGDKRLVGYVVVQSETPIDARELKSYLGERLPAHMVPAVLVFLDELPVTGNGKVDRRALLEITLPGPGGTRTLVPPRTALEAELVELWKTCLGIAELSVDDAFSDLGGDSLRAMQLISRARLQWGAELPLGSFFPKGTVAKQAVALKALPHAPALYAEPLRPALESKATPLSPQQQPLWFLHRLDSNSQAYAIVLAYQLTGSLDVQALEWALNQVTQRHQVLRSRFTEVGGHPLQGPPRDEKLSLNRISVADAPGGSEDLAYEQALAAAARVPLHPMQGPLIQATLLSRTDQDHTLVLLVHHLVFDGWSEGILFRELAHYYRQALQTAGKLAASAPTEVLPPLAIQYGDYASWCKTRKGPAWEAHWERLLAFWRTTLSDAPRCLELPYDYPHSSGPLREPSKGDGHPAPAGAAEPGKTLVHWLPATLVEQASRFSQEQGCTLFTTLLTAYQLVLARYTQQDDLVVGIPVAERNRPELESLIGFFVNTFPLRTDLTGNPTWQQLVQRVEAGLTQALDHSQLPLDEIVRALSVERQANSVPLIQTVFLLHDVPLQMSPLNIKRVPLHNGTAKFELTWQCVRVGAELQLWLEYDARKFRPETILQLANYFERLLGVVLEQPQVPVLDLPMAVTPGLGSVTQRTPVEVGNGTPLGATDSNILPQLREVWQSLLGGELPRPTDDFFRLGGHSLLTLELAAKIDTTFGARLSIAELFEFRTLGAQAKLISRQVSKRTESPLLTVRAGDGKPLILLPNIGGQALAAYWLVQHLPSSLPLLAIQLKAGPASDNNRIQPVTLEERAAACLLELDQARISPPFQLLGYSFGGMLAYELARQIHARGQEVSYLGLIDTGPNRRQATQLFTPLQQAVAFACNVGPWLFDGNKLQELPAELWHRLLMKLKARSQPGSNERDAQSTGEEPLPAELQLRNLPRYLRWNTPQERQTIVANYHAYCQYRPAGYPGKVTLYRAQVRPLLHHLMDDAGWDRNQLGELEIRMVTGNHTSLFDDPNGAKLAHLICEDLLKLSQ